MNNQTDVSIKFKNYVTGEKKLKEYSETLTKIKSVLKGLDTGVTKELEKSAKNTKGTSEDIKDINKYVKSAFNYTAVREFSRALQRTFSEMSRLVTKSTEYLENINLYQVAFDGNYKSADRFINKMTEMYGLDESWLTRTVGIFKQLSNAMGVSAETGEKLSTLLTQMSLDISSLYNVDMERASSVLQSAMAGQTKPIRGLTGGDITQATLQTTLDNLGIERAVSTLSFAEKRLLIIISLTQQLNESIGDMGRTIESPANQMRVLNSQWERFSRALGNVMMPILSKILPYLNAIMMVLTEIISTFAILLGYNAEDYDYFSGTSDSALELKDNLDGATASANKLKQGLRGFDKLNVITTPTSGGVGVGGGIDSSLMGAFNDAFEDYQNKLADVEMKATRIRDSIMSWLGFTKEVDEETGKISFKFERITSGTILGALAVGGSIFAGIKKIFGFVKGIKLFTSTSTITNTASKVGILSGSLSKLGTIIGTSVASGGLVVPAIGALLAILGALIHEGLQPASERIDIFKNISEETTQKVKPFITQMEKLSLSITKLDFADIVTKEDVNKIKTNLNNATKLIKDDYYNDVLETEKKLQDLNLYPELTLAERTKLINQVKKTNEERIKEINNAEQKILDIVNNASQEKRNLTEEEKNVILGIYEELRTEGVKTMTENAEEQRVILTRLKNDAENLTTEQYSNILKEAKKNKDEMYKEAEEKYNNEIALANKLRYDLKTIDDEKYQEMLDSAKTNYDAMVKETDEKFGEISDTVKTKMGDASKEIDLTTGEIRSNFEMFIFDIKTWWDSLEFVKDIKVAIKPYVEEVKTKSAQQEYIWKQNLPSNWSSGAFYADGGLPPVGQIFVANERGPELVGHIGGQSFVANQNQMMNLLDSKIGNTKTSFNPTFIVQVGDETVAKKVLRNLEDMVKTDGKPITIGA